MSFDDHLFDAFGEFAQRIKFLINHGWDFTYEDSNRYYGGTFTFSKGQFQVCCSSLGDIEDKVVRYAGLKFDRWADMDEIDRKYYKQGYDEYWNKELDVWAFQLGVKERNEELL